MSAEVTAGAAALAEDYSRLWWDLWFGHKHGITAEAIDHGDLKELSAELAGTYLTHKKLDLHVQADGTSLDPDTTGGSQGVHGLGGGDHIVGVGTHQLLVQCGADRAGPNPEKYGPRGYRGRYYYARPYKKAPFVFITPYWPGPIDESDWLFPFRYGVYQSFWSNFTVQLKETVNFPYEKRGGGTGQPTYIDFFWIAFGEEGTPPKNEKQEYEWLL
jgi:hypothetical protein